MEIIGRVTADAKTSELKDGRKVVNFSIAINDSYQAKGHEEVTKVVTYVNCTYWQHPGIATHLTKGQLVELYGRMGVNAWINAEGESKAGLTFHVNNIKLHGSKSATERNGTQSDSKKPGPATVAEDLPF